MHLLCCSWQCIAFVEHQLFFSRLPASLQSSAALRQHSAASRQMPSSVGTRIRGLTASIREILQPLASQHEEVYAALQVFEATVFEFFRCAIDAILLMLSHAHRKHPFASCGIRFCIFAPLAQPCSNASRLGMPRIKLALMGA